MIHGLSVKARNTMFHSANLLPSLNATTFLSALSVMKTISMIVTEFLDVKKMESGLPGFSFLFVRTRSLFLMNVTFQNASTALPG